MRNLPRLIFSLNFLYILLIAAQIVAIVFLCLYIPAFLPAALCYVILWLVNAATAAVLFSRKGAPEVKSAWFVLITAIPVAGALIYLIATVKRKPCGILNVHCKSVQGLSAAANALCGTAEAGYDSVKYFRSGAEFFKSLTEEIARAKSSVYIEFFIINRGHIFNSVLAALERAKANGAEIKIILDGIGSAFKIRKKDIKRLEAAGAEVKIFHRLIPFPLPRLNYRDHRKIVTVDGKTAYTGGLNLADEYANLISPYGYWKDTGVAVYGPASKIFEGMFLSVWNGSHDMQAPEGGKFRCLPFYDSPASRSFCEDAYVYALSTANQRVHIMTPYFCVSEKTAAALAFTAKRGVDVKIIIPHIPDKKYAFAISKAFARALAESGVEFYEYTPGFMHAKCLICDDRVFLGSYNFDFRSTHFNYECGVLFQGLPAEEVERDFDECLSLSSPLSVSKIPPVTRFKQFILKLFAPLI